MILRIWSTDSMRAGHHQAGRTAFSQCAPWPEPRSEDRPGRNDRYASTLSRRWLRPQAHFF